MLSLPLVKIQQSPGGWLFAGRVSVPPLQRGIGEEQRRQLLQQRPGFEVAHQQIKRPVLDGVEGHWTANRCNAMA